MNIPGRNTAIGVFVNHNQAESALEELHRAGFTNEQTGFITRHQTDEGISEFSNDTATNVPGTAAGAVGGGVIAGVIGAAASLLIPGLGIALAGGILAAVFGAVAGGFAGSLISIGIPEEEAHYYQEQLVAGYTLVSVHAHGRYEEAVAIMRGCGAFDATVMPGMPKSVETNVAELHNSDGVEASSTEVSLMSNDETPYASYDNGETELRNVVPPSRDVADQLTAQVPAVSDPA